MGEIGQRVNLTSFAYVAYLHSWQIYRPGQHPQQAPQGTKKYSAASTKLSLHNPPDIFLAPASAELEQIILIPSDCLSERKFEQLI